MKKLKRKPATKAKVVVVEKRKPKRKVRTMNRPDDETHKEREAREKREREAHEHEQKERAARDKREPIPGPDQGEQSPTPTYPGATTGGPLVEPKPDKREPHPIEAALESIDEAVRKNQGGPPGSGIKALLALVAAQIGVKVA